MKRYYWFLIGNLLASVLFMAAGFVFDAHATIVKTSTRTVNTGPADFGSGNHSGGGPSGPATITFDWSTASGSFVATGRVRGTLYWDDFFSEGCTRLTVRFRNSAGTSLRTRQIEECGPGGNANDLDNRTGVDESFASGGNFADILITVAALNNNGDPINPSSFIFTHPTEFRYPLLVENSRADFGNGNHSFGAPEESGFVGFRRNLNGTLTGGVDGVLYKDTLTQTQLGCSTIVITYRSSTGAVLDTFSPMNCGPGGNANLPANQLFVNDAFSSGSLAQIRVVVNSNLTPNSPNLSIFNFTGEQ